MIWLKLGIIMDRKEFLLTSLAGLIFADLSCTKVVKRRFSDRKLIVIKLNGGIDSLAIVATDRFSSTYGHHIENPVKNDELFVNKQFFNSMVSPCLDFGINYRISNSCGHDLKNNSHFISSNFWELNNKGKGYFNDIGGHVFNLGDNNFFAGSQNILDIQKIIQFKKFKDYVPQEKLSSKISCKEVILLNKLAEIEVIDSNAIDLLIDSDLKSISFEYNGFDTHSAQQYKLQRSLGQFYSTFGKIHRHMINNDLVLFVYSEFGRTIDFNSSKGTDHGMGGFCFIMGGDDELYSDLNIDNLKAEIVTNFGTKRVLESVFNANHIKKTLHSWVSS